jgi:hypothetical protein
LVNAASRGIKPPTRRYSGCCTEWVELTLPADPLYQHLLLAEKKFWCWVMLAEEPSP